MMDSIVLSFLVIDVAMIVFYLPTRIYIEEGYEKSAKSENTVIFNHKTMANKSALDMIKI